MAITRKPGPAQSLALVGQIPVPPDIPDSFSDRFPELKAWQEASDRWWNRFQDLLQRDLDQIATQFKTDELNLQTLIDGLNQQIAALTAQIAGIPGGGSGGIAAQLAAIVANLAAVSSGLAAHIAATITHGTSSPIVGTQDAQDLDQKRIGLTGPRYGRAWPAVGVKSIPAGEVITLGVSDAIITAAPFMVYGQLIIDGTLLVL